MAANSLTEPQSQTTVVISSSNGVVNCEDEADSNYISGLSEWDSAPEAAHIPSAITGFGTAERTHWFEQQREKEKKQAEDLKEQRRQTLKASQERVKVGVDDHFESHSVESLEVQYGKGGLMTKRMFVGDVDKEEIKAQNQKLEKEEKKAKKRKKLKQSQDKLKLSFVDDEGDNP